MGDLLLSRPVIDTLVEGGYIVDFLARQSTSVALAGHPGIRDLLTISEKDPANVAQMKAWAKTLRSRNYSTALLLWSTSRWAWTLRWAKIPQRVGQDSRLLYSFNFTHPVHVRSEHGDQESHWTDILLDYPKALGLISEKPPTVTYPIDEQAAQTTEALIRQANFGSHQGPLLGFHSGKGLPLGPERWPVRHFAKLAKELQDRLDARLILTGGPGEVEIV